MVHGVEELNMLEQEMSTNNSKPIWDLVIEDMVQRNKVGAEKYNRYLTASCPDNMLRHAYEEALDLAVYLKTLMVKESQAKREPVDFSGMMKELEIC